MPVTTFNVRWPDGKQESCYSPSSVIKNYFQIEHEYTVPEFLSVCDQALNEASERVRQKYGYACSSAMDQLSTIQMQCKRYDDPNSVIVVYSIK
ncbi:MSMEG_0570 family nitrogen starvation response protein [Rhodanobacter aciditrophus]|uniref:MSMEG_0570 family nitrogen starvation response protein n=1 Tax=Rhodanobacter aciditrophus TaxID=1623218 RepID=A0ABW4B0F5_9GAMM